MELSGRGWKRNSVVWTVLSSNAQGKGLSSLHILKIQRWIGGRYRRRESSIVLLQFREMVRADKDIKTLHGQFVLDARTDG